MSVPAAQWQNWQWQQRSAIRTAEQLLELLPGVSESDVAAIERHRSERRFQVTRHYLSLIERTPDGSAPRLDDPLWRQMLPADGTEAGAAYQYDGTENWEMPEEMVTPIAQRKYHDRIIVRASNVCHAYCQFCYEALRTLERDSDKPAFNLTQWEQTLDYLRAHPEVREVILSGGEPLMQSDVNLGRLLGDLRALPGELAIRIHTRALSFNPFRITPELCTLFEQHAVNAIGVHATHVREIGPDFVTSVERLRRSVPILFANVPLLRGVNDSAEAIQELGMRLYMLGVSRGYLYHFMPHSPGAERFATPVRAGIDILRALKRNMTNLAVPEYVLPHHSGKHTIPLLGVDEDPPLWEVAASGEPIVRYVNWRGDTIEYPDLPVASQ
jgi:lysine 2,3-aminomutase